MVKKITKTVYVVDDHEYATADEALLAERIKRMENLLVNSSAWRDLSTEPSLRELAEMLVKHADMLVTRLSEPVPCEDETQVTPVDPNNSPMPATIRATDYDSAMDSASWGNPHRAPDADFEAENDANEAPRRLAVRRERVAAQNQASTRLCVCANKHVEDVTLDVATGCLHCDYCGGIYVDKSPDATPAEVERVNEAPRRPFSSHPVRGHERDETTNRCVDCGSRHYHSRRCPRHIEYDRKGAK